MKIYLIIKHFCDNSYFLLKQKQTSCRNSSHGLWTSTLLFFAYLQTILRNPKTVQLNYELSTIILAGLTLQSFEIFLTFASEKIPLWMKIALKIVPSCVTSILMTQILDQEIIFTVITASVIMVMYNLTLMYTLKSMPRCFTFGEATIIIQGFTIFLFNCILNLPNMNDASYINDQLNIILQLGLLGILVIIAVTHFIPIFRSWCLFYLVLFFVTFTLCITTLHEKFAITILYDFIFNDIERIIIVGLYVFLLLLACVAVSWQIKSNQKGTTAARKTFHVLIVLVYIPGLVYQCHLLYVASVVIMAVFIILELARVIKLWPVDGILEMSVKIFIDEQDAGQVALTPLYLLIGCSLPLWIHNSPCDLTGSTSFEFLPLIAGVLSVGIGDMFASVVGSKFGKIKWGKSIKSVEGTLASIVAQGIFIYGLYMIEFIHLDLKLTALCGIAVITNALVETFTHQVDNLVLPILTYIILMYK